MPRPGRALLCDGLVAEGENEVHLRRKRAREFMPGLASQSLCRDAQALEKTSGRLADFAGWLHARAESSEAGTASQVHQGLCQNSSGRVPGTQKQYVVA